MKYTSAYDPETPEHPDEHHPARWAAFQRMVRMAEIGKAEIGKAGEVGSWVD